MKFRKIVRRIQFQAGTRDILDKLDSVSKTKPPSASFHEGCPTNSWYKATPIAIMAAEGVDIGAIFFHSSQREFHKKLLKIFSKKVKDTKLFYPSIVNITGCPHRLDN